MGKRASDASNGLEKIHCTIRHGSYQLKACVTGEIKEDTDNKVRQFCDSIISNTPFGRKTVTSNIIELLNPTLGADKTRNERVYIQEQFAETIRALAGESPPKHQIEKASNALTNALATAYPNAEDKLGILVGAIGNKLEAGQRRWLQGEYKKTKKDKNPTESKGGTVPLFISITPFLPEAEKVAQDNDSRAFSYGKLTSPLKRQRATTHLDQLEDKDQALNLMPDKTPVGFSYNLQLDDIPADLDTLKNCIENGIQQIVGEPPATLSAPPTNVSGYSTAAVAIAKKFGVTINPPQEPVHPASKNAAPPIIAPSSSSQLTPLDVALHELRALFTGEDGKVIVTETPGTTTGQLLAEHKANVDPRAMKALLGNGNRNTLLRQLPPEEHASFEGIWNQLTSLTGHKSAPSPDSFVQLKQKLRSLITDEEGFELTAREISKGCQLSNAVYLLISDAPQPIPPSLISQETEGKIADFLKNTLGKPDAEVAGFRSTFAKLRAMNAERRSSPHHVRRHADDESPRSR